VDPKSGKGSCCTDDKVFDGTNCAVPSPPQPPPTPCTASCGQATDGKQQAFCHGKVACPTEFDLGISYGKCYVLSFPDGKQLGRQVNGAYEKNGRWQDIPFKVCTDTFDCKAGGPVKFKDAFTLQDQLGLPEDVNSGRGWINNFSGGSHKSYTPNKALAAIFKGSFHSSSICSCITDKTKVVLAALVMAARSASTPTPRVWPLLVPMLFRA
jgi:hypothetical protein